MFSEVADNEYQYYWIRDEKEEYLPVRRCDNNPVANYDEEIAFEVFNTGRIMKCPQSAIVGNIPSPGNVTLSTNHEDLVENDDISEASVMWNIKIRFFADEIYSSIGPIIIAINPYKHISSLYSSEALDTYRNSGNTDNLATPPHIWRISHGAYMQLKTRRVRGESGAGKTETTKKCLQYVSALAANQSTEKTTDELPIEDRVIGTNPLLESFGNSKTAKNDNSSRFGKWLEINFAPDLDPLSTTQNIFLTGANITQYLLEKSRVVFQSRDERNFHIFYQLCTDASMDLGSVEDYHFLTQSGCTTVSGIDDTAEMAMTMQAFKALLFPEEDVFAILSALKAILFLGNINFEPNETDGNASVDPATESWIAKAAEMLTVPRDRLANCLTSKVINVRGELMESPLTPSQSVDTRNALAKEMYGRLFCQIVAQANESLSPQAPVSENDTQFGPATQLADSRDLCIGLLDIFGFELLRCNSFEQLCINFANEKLQQYFLQFVLKKEQEIYDSEGVDVPKVIPRDNEDVLLLCEARGTGIFACLDEEVKIPRGTDAGFLNKIEGHHNKKTAESRFFRDVKMAKTQFEIRHFAGVVRYESVGFLDKNKDKLYDHLEDLLSEAENPHFRRMMEHHGPREVAQVVQAKAEANMGDKGDSKSVKRRSSVTSKAIAASRERAPTTLANRFQSQLNQLISVLNSSDAHFVRCIKPNSTKAAGELDNSLVLRQLQYSGVLEAIQIRKNGYPTRRSLMEFRRSYWMMSGLSQQDLRELSDSEKCHAVVDRLKSMDAVYNELLVGKTMVFFRPEVLQALELERLKRGRKAVLFGQSKARMLVAKATISLLWAARNTLREVIAEGSLLNSCNVEALPRLQDYTRHCVEELNLHCVEVKLAATLIQRLTDIQTCKQRITELLAYDAAEGYTDVLEEYQAVKAVLLLAAEIGLVTDDLPKLEALNGVLEERGEALLALRSAMEYRDDGALKRSLQSITLLNSKYGVFCSADEELGRSLLETLMKEIVMIEEGLKVVMKFQVDYKAKQAWELSTAEPEAMEQEIWSWIDKNVPITNATMAAVLAPFEESSCVAPMAALARDIFKSIVSLREFWVHKEWPKVAFSIQGMLSAAKEITSFSKPCSQTMKSRGTELVKALESEVEFVRSELDWHMVLPMLVESLKYGRVAEGDGKDVDLAGVNYEMVQSALKDVKSLDWCGAAVKKLIKRTETIALARKLVTEKKWDDILFFTEVEEDAMRRRFRLQAYLDRLNEIVREMSVNSTVAAVLGKKMSEKRLTVEGLGIMTGLSDRPITAEAEPVGWLPSVNFLVAETVEGLTGVFKVEADKIEKELALIRQVAFQKYLEILAGLAVDIGRATGEVDSGIDLILDRINVEAIDSFLDELEYLQQLNSADMQLTTTMAFVVQSIRHLREVRHHVMGQDWSQLASAMNADFVMDMVKMDLAGSGYSGTSLELLKDIRAEIGRVALFSRNKLATARLLDALRGSTSIKGVVGQLDVSDCNVTSIVAMIANAEQCCNDPEFPGTTEELRLLIAFSKALVGARRAFMAPFDLKDRKHYITKLMEAMQADALSITPEAEREVFLLQNDLRFIECRNLLQEGLHLPTPVRYVLPSTSSQGSDAATLGDEELSESDELQLNMEVLFTESLEEGLDIACALREALPDGLPQEFHSLLRTCEMITAMRRSVREQRWADAAATFQEIKSEKLVEAVPIIEEELIGCEEPINNYLVISTCESALSAGAPIGRIGLLDPDTASMSALENAIKISRETGCKSNRAEQLFKATLVIAELRRAQRAADWGAIKHVLGLADEKNLGHGAYGLCAQELKRANVERENYEAVYAMKRALTLETIPHTNGLIEFEKATVEKLTSSCSTVHMMATDSRGDVTAILCNLCETVLKARRAASQKNEFLFKSMLLVWKKELAVFQNNLDKIAMGHERPHAASIRKHSTLNLRKGSLTDQGTAAAESPTVSVSGYVLPPMHSKSFEEFTKMTDTLEEELRSIDHHYALLELEALLLSALTEDGLTVEMLGCVDVSKILVTKIRGAMEKKSVMESDGLPVHPPLLAIFKCAALIVEMRSTISLNVWDTLPALLEEAVTGQDGPLPDVCRQEIQVIRHEVENRWILANITDALSHNKIEGSLGNVKLSGVAYEPLELAVNACTALTPRTFEAANLVHTGEVILPLRRLLCDEEINWHLVRECVDNILAPVNATTLHPSVLPEMRLIKATAEDMILCMAMETALKRGGPTGDAGRMQIDTVDSLELTAVCQTAIEKAVTTAKATQLWTACSKIKNLREALERTRNGDEQTIAESRHSIKTIVDNIFSTFKSSPDVGGAWALCREEVLLVSKDAHVRELYDGIVEAVTKTFKIYDNRNKMSIGQSKKSGGGTMETKLTCADLDKVIEYASRLEFQSELLTKYSNCAKHLRKFRTFISFDNWDDLKTLLDDDSIEADIETISLAMQEYGYVKQESHNYQVIYTIEKALAHPQAAGTNIAARSGDDGYDSDTDRETTAMHAALQSAIEVAEVAVVTSVTAKQLLDCAKTTLLLRRGLHQHNSKDVAKALKWFSNNAHRCPPTTQQEAQRAYIIHQNDVIYTGLLQALSTGKATGIRGALDMTTIEVEPLYKLLEKAKDVKHQTATVKELLEAGEIIYVLRTAIRDGDMGRVSMALGLIEDRKIIVPLILEEVAMYKAEAENYATLTALFDALAAFDDSGSKSLEMALFGATQSIVEGTDSSFFGRSGSESTSGGAAVHSEATGGLGGSGAESYSRMAIGRRFSLSPLPHTDIQVNAIDVSDLEHALETAREHGILSTDARRLYRTAMLIRSLRVAMKMCDWERVEEILTEASLSKGMALTTAMKDHYDVVAFHEIQVIQIQLEMRKSIQALAAALKTGWARCSNGIVDVTIVSVDDILQAVERAEKSILELGLNPNRKIPPLISSALTKGAISAGGASSVGGAGASAGKKGQYSEKAGGISVVSAASSLASILEDDEEEFKSRSGGIGGSATAVDGSITGKSIPSSKIQLNVELLLTSAKLVAEIRRKIKKREMELAGAMAEEALLADHLHTTVRQELQLYASEINRALHMMKLCASLREGMHEDLETLEPLIIEAKKVSVQLSNDLGLIRTLEKARVVYKSFLSFRRALVKLSNNYNVVEVERTIANAVAINISGFLIDNAKKRLGMLKEFEVTVDFCRKGRGGVLAHEGTLRDVLTHAESLSMKRHPVAMRSQIYLKLAPPAFRTVLIAEAVQKNKAFVAATETIRLKRAYLSLASSRARYTLERFPGLRKPADFTMRVSAVSKDAPESMLTHSFNSIPTSLTYLSPALAALSVWIFSHCIHGIARQIYSKVEVLLRNMIILGRNCPAIRDELFLQIVKQLRGNDDPNACDRLWRTLGACLSHFPPSQQFENYLELFLITESEKIVQAPGHASAKAVAAALAAAVPASPAAKQCIRFMHESVFQYGYSKVIITPRDTALRTISQWLGEGYSSSLVKRERIGTAGSLGHGLQAMMSAGGGELFSNSGGGTGPVSPVNVTSMIAAPASNTSVGSTMVDLPFTDPAFSEGPGSVPVSIAPPHIRCTRGNWIDRFNNFRISGGGENKSGSGGGGPSASETASISLEFFLEALSHTSTVIDKLDRDCLMYLVLGKIPEKRIKIIREYRGDQTSFHYLDDEEYRASYSRRDWMRRNVSHAIPPHPALPALKPSDRKAYAKEFWMRIIEKMAVDFMSSPALRGGAEAGPKRRGSKGAASSSSASASASSSQAAASSATTINWEIYRELVLTSMELFFVVDEEHRAEQASAAVSAAQAGRPGSVAGGVAVTGKNVPLGFHYEGFVMYSVNSDTGGIDTVDRRGGSGTTEEGEYW